MSAPGLDELVADAEREAAGAVRVAAERVVAGADTNDARKACDSLDGVRVARAVLHDRRLLHCTDVASAREALGALNTTAHALGCTGKSDIVTGVDLVRFRVARHIEQR
jgi:hypothetical protein